MRAGPGLISSQEKRGVKFRETVEQVEFRDREQLKTIMSGSGSMDLSEPTNTQTVSTQLIQESEDDDSYYDSDESDNQIIASINQAKLKRDSVNLTERRLSSDPPTETAPKRRDSFMMTALRLSSTNRQSESNHAEEGGDQDESQESSYSGVPKSSLRVVNADIRQTSSSSLSIQEKMQKRGSLSSYSGKDKYGLWRDDEEEQEQPKKEPKSRRGSIFTFLQNPPEEQEGLSVEDRRISGSTIKSNLVRESAVIKLFDVEKVDDFARTSHVQPIINPEDMEQAKESTSIHTKSTVSIGMSKFPHAQEVSETLSTRLLAMKYIFIACLLNTGLILLAWKMQSPFQLPLAPPVVHVTVGVIVEIVALLTNELTIYSLGEETQKCRLAHTYLI
ncbi:UNVERIFIED_CONTAM: hypothetical protein HDU68_002897 [Siphonaria sp. JEL0065]|nr:hypothetical protein HDU68_002897 [Siphonaria sp. JEL0065]